MLLKIYQTGQPVLRKRAGQVTRKVLSSDETQRLIDSMIETLRDVPGVGLAAPQVGQPLQICIIEDKAAYHKQVPDELLKEQGRKPVSLKVFVNPRLEILDSSDAVYFEGCLSVEGYVGAVARASKIKITALDRHGREVTYTAAGWYARILQHELDHLNGELYIDKLQPKSFISARNFTQLWRAALQAKIRAHFQ